jgi:hypothetical protein
MFVYALCAIVCKVFVNVIIVVYKEIIVQPNNVKEKEE